MYMPQRGCGLQFSSSLKNNYEFRRLYAKGKSAVTPLMAVYYRRNGTPGNRLGITVGKKVGNAVTRNRVRRRLKESYRLSEELLRTGYDIVIVARVKSKDAAYQALEADMLRLFKKLNLMR